MRAIRLETKKPGDAGLFLFSSVIVDAGKILVP
jgi:hypothetical protein